MTTLSGGKMNKQKKVRKKILKLLKKTKKQFYNEEGDKITPEEYLDLLLKQKTQDMNDFLNKIKRRRK